MSSLVYNEEDGWFLFPPIRNPGTPTERDVPCISANKKLPQRTPLCPAAKQKDVIFFIFYNVKEDESGQSPVIACLLYLLSI
jgi:hypothetical protein